LHVYLVPDSRFSNKELLEDNQGYLKSQCKQGVEYFHLKPQFEYSITNYSSFFSFKNYGTQINMLDVIYITIDA